MQVTLKIDDRKKFHILVSIFSFISPFNSLSKREREVLAELNYYYSKLPGIDERKRNRLIFDYDTRREISEHLGVKTEQIYNIVSLLKKKGIIEKNQLVPKYIIKNVEKLTFIFDANIEN